MPADRHLPVSRLLDLPADRALPDELGTPDHALARCPDCRHVFRRGGWHYCQPRGERVTWPDYQARHGDPDGGRR